MFAEMREQNRFKKLPEAEREVVFYAEHGGYWPNFEGLVHELTVNHGRTVSYVTSEDGDPILKDPPDGVRPFLIRDTLVHFMALLKCRVVVMTLADLHQFHLKRSKHPVHYVYAFHSLVSTHMMYREGAFDHYDSVLATGPHHVAEIRAEEQRRGLKPKQLVEAGYYRLERIHARYRRYRDEHGPNERTTVLVAPSWGDANVLESVGERLVELLLGSGFDVIVRPHPETVKRTPELLDALEASHGGNPAFTLERSVATDESLLRADLLVCDLSGVALEYAFGTERPVFFLDVPPKVQNPGYAELGIQPVELALRPELGETLSREDLDAVPDAVARLCSDPSGWQAKLAELRDRHVFAFGRSSAIGADHILGLL